MEEFKIIKMKDRLTEEEIERAADFGQLLDKHQQYVKKKKWIAGGVITAGAFLLAAIIYLSVDNNKEKPIANEKTPTEISTSHINRPFDIEEEKDTFKINNQLGDTIQYGNTKIIVPPNSFVDINGEPINGDVFLSYEEYHTPVEAFISGIPMKYDSADYEYHFETAGMFDIRGFTDSEEVFLANNIEVQLASKQSGNYFNQYYFDEEKGAWNYLSTDTSGFASLPDSIDKRGIDQQLRAVEQAINNLEKYKPVKRKPNSVCIELEVDSTEFPELISFKGILFEIDDDETEFHKEYVNLEWDDAKLKKTENGIELYVYKNYKKTILSVKPVYEGVSFTNALRKYEQVNRKRKDSLLTKKRKLFVQLTSFSNEMLANSDIENFVCRIFSVNKFGVYNCDNPQRMPKGQLLAVEYLRRSESTKKDTLKLKSLYLVEEDKNTLYTLRLSSTLSFNPNNKTAMWGVTLDNKLVVFKSSYFEEIPKNHQGVYNLEFDLVAKDLFSKENVIKKLDIEALFDSI